MNKKTTLIIGIAVFLLCLVCIVVAGIGGYVYQDKILALLGLAPAQKVAAMLPAETQFYMSVTPNIQNMAGYQNLKKLYFDNPDIQALFDEVETEMSDEAGITYENDIKPWLGTEVVIAAPDFTKGIKAQSQDPFASAPTPNFILAAETINQEASNNFISKVLAEAVKKDNPYTDEVYQDVTLHHQKNGKDTTTLATFNNFVVASNSDALVKGMIDQAQGKDVPVLADSERFKKITGELPPSMLSLLSSSWCIDARAGSAPWGRFVLGLTTEIDNRREPFNRFQPIFHPLPTWRRLRRWTRCLEQPSIRAGRFNQTPNTAFVQRQTSLSLMSGPI